MPKVNFKVPKRSGFDKSHSNLLTADCGTITPILTDELIPNTKVHLRSIINAQLPPLATDAFMRVNLKIEAFFVPSRLLYGGFASWIAREEILTPDSNTPFVPALPIGIVAPNVQVASGTLLDYLGMRTIENSETSSIAFNLFPLLAYHRIWSDWYRNPLVQRDCFSSVPTANDATSAPIYRLPFVSLKNGLSFGIDKTLADGHVIAQLRQRNFGFDYFTGAMPNLQLGSNQTVSISSNKFTIAALRAANSLQQFAERNQLAGPRLQDFVKANYGADLSSGVAQRSIYLGSAEIPVYSKGIYQQNNEVETTTNNPFRSVGAKYGDASANGECNLVEDFIAQEPGYLMVMATLVPVVAYSSGIERMMRRYNAQNSQTDMATPLLQNVGNQPIYMNELTGARDATQPGIFGFTDRYADFKQKQSSIHGLLRDGNNLSAFALQRTVTGNPSISNDFLEIPYDFMDQVCATNTAVSSFGVWINVYHDYKVSMPLAEYSIPSLQDPAYEHGINVPIQVGGSRV